MILHSHNDETDKLVLIAVANDLCVEITARNLFWTICIVFHGYVHNDHFSQGKENHNSVTTIL